MYASEDGILKSLQDHNEQEAHIIIALLHTYTVGPIDNRRVVKEEEEEEEE